MVLANVVYHGIGRAGAVCRGMVIFFFFLNYLLFGFFGLDWLSSSSVQYPACVFFVEVTFYWFGGRLDGAELGVESWFGAKGLFVVVMLR